MKPLKSQNFYEILNISHLASQEDIRKAYEISKTTFQGDSLATYSLFSGEENEEIFSLISRAYETLRNPHTRQEYDDQLAQEGTPSEGWQEEQIASAIGSGGERGLGAAAKPGNSMQGGGGDFNSLVDQPAPAQQPESIPGLEKYIATVNFFDGPVLKKIRQMQGLDLEELAEKTKIRRAYLEYLEKEDYAFLPAPVYIKGFVILIANVLGLPSQRVAGDYMVNYQAKADPDSFRH